MSISRARAIAARAHCSWRTLCMLVHCERRSQCSHCLSGRLPQTLRLPSSCRMTASGFRTPAGCRSDMGRECQFAAEDSGRSNELHWAWCTQSRLHIPDRSIAGSGRRRTDVWYAANTVRLGSRRHRQHPLHNRHCEGRNVPSLAPGLGRAGAAALDRRMAELNRIGPVRGSCGTVRLPRSRGSVLRPWAGIDRARRSAVPASGTEARRRAVPLLYAVGPPALTHCRTTSLNTSSGTEPVFSTTS
jgi:hypothetical protein